MTATPVPTTFYRQIERNRRRSWLLIAAVVLILGLMGGAIGYATDFGWLGVVVAVSVAMAMTVGSYFAGDKLVLASSGARAIDPANPPEQFRQLVNVVTEMKLASGLPMPRLYVIDDSAPNAFATGRDPKHASVAVTTGLLDKLDREQLQGVIAHELSHIGNFDIRFTLLIGVLVGAIALLADWFLRYTFWFGGGRRGGGGGSDKGSGGAAIALFIIAIVLAILAPLLSRIIQAAVSRSRESLADVSAVELTRNPVGLARALRAIADDREVLEVANRATQHLYFVNPIKSYEERASSMWDTHPPVGERIRTLESLAGRFGQAVPPGLHPAEASQPASSG